MTTNDMLRVTDSRTGRSYEIPIVDGAIRAIDLRQIKTSDDDFGLLSYDPAFQNTASCRSAITFIDGDRGILRYRGYPIEELANRATFLDVAWLLLNGEMPDKTESAAWARQISQHTYVHENIKKFIDGFHYDAHPMGMLISTLAALSTFYPQAKNVHDKAVRDEQVIRLIAKMPTMAAFAYRHALGLPYAYPDDDLTYAGNFLNMMRRMTEPKYKPNPSSSTPSTCCSSCTPTMSRTAPPTRCAAWPVPRSTRTRRPRRPRRRCTARCTAARTSRC